MAALDETLGGASGLVGAPLASERVEAHSNKSALASDAGNVGWSAWTHSKSLHSSLPRLTACGRSRRQGRSAFIPATRATACRSRVVLRDPLRSAVSRCTRVHTRSLKATCTGPLPFKARRRAVTHTGPAATDCALQGGWARIQRSGPSMLRKRSARRHSYPLVLSEARAMTHAGDAFLRGSPVRRRWTS